MSPSATTAQLGTATETASHATKDTEFPTDSAKQTESPNPPMRAAQSGIGTPKPAFRALFTTSKLRKDSASKSALNAKLTTATENAQHATKATTSNTTAHANSLTRTLFLPPTSDAETGTGITKNVFRAHSDGLSTKIEFASQSVISV